MTEMRALPESEDSSFKGALVKAIPAIGVLFGFRPGVVAGTTVTNTNEENTRREGLFVVRKLLELSAAYLGKAPWITYLAAKRHSHWTSQFGISTAAFSDFSDKKLVDETARLASDLEAKASALMDSETSANMQELLRFQESKHQLAETIQILEHIIGSPHRPAIIRRLQGREPEGFVLIEPSGTFGGILTLVWAFFIFWIYAEYRREENEPRSGASICSIRDYWDAGRYSGHDEI